MMEKKPTILVSSKNFVTNSKLKKRLQRCTGIALITVLILAFAIALTPLNDLLTLPLTHVEQPIKADIIIVLGSGLRRDGTVGKNGQERVLEGILLDQQGFAPTIIMSGGPVKHTEWYESDQMAAYALAHTTIPLNVVEERRSTSTEENALFSHALMEQNGWNTALLVTSSFHTKRACAVFRKQDIQITCVAADKKLVPRISPIDRFDQFKGIIREYGAIVFYKMKGYI